MLPVTGVNVARRGALRVRMMIWAIALFGLFVPVIPRVLVPRLRPGIYADAYEHLSDFTAIDLATCVWSAVPYVILALLANEARRDDAISIAALRRTFVGVVAAFIAITLFGFWMFIPGPPRGVTLRGLWFAPCAFLIEAIVYTVGQSVARRLLESGAQS